ncbi:aminotransferase class IV family protein [Streptomyces pratensis]|uniref:aminotransferase class IV family protein n=1 Tax=Streptomyces pratensis TaxID=1169025 RepID=UPI003016F1DE
MNDDFPYTVHLDGRAVGAQELAPLAFAGHAHFTAMQVRGGRVRGLDLHLERLRSASVELFGRALPEDRVRALLRAALRDGPADLSLTATVYSAAGEYTAADAGLSLLVRTGPASSGPGGPLTLAAMEHERFLPHLKQVGEGAKTHLLRQAVAEGFDDAAFLDREGRIGEASIWNLAFWDGHSVVWPRARILTGTTMGILARRLEELGVPQRTAEIALADLPVFVGAVVMNSWTPGVAVHRIGPAELPAAPPFLELLHRAYATEPLTAP